MGTPNTQITEEQFKRLPKYAQEYIRDLERERETALKVMRKLEDDQTPTKVWESDFESLGERKGPTEVIRYFDCDRLEIESAGVRLSIGGLWDDKEITLSWRPAGEGHPLGDVLFIPTSYQQAKFVALENGR